MRLLHKLVHFSHMQGGYVISAWDGPDLHIGFKCSACGEESGWHKSKVTWRVLSKAKQFGGSS